MSESLTPATVESKKSDEKTESIVNIGYEHLPGNFGSSERIVNAVHDKWNAYKTWGETLGNRLVSNAYEETATRHELNFNSYEKRRDELENKLDTITAAKDQILDSDSLLNRFAATRWINQSRAEWKTFRENRLKSKIARYDGRIKREGSYMREARANKSVIDRRINRTVEKNTRRLDDRIRTARFHKEKSDATVEKFESIIMRNEQVLTTLQQALEIAKGKRRESRRGDGKVDVYQKQIDEIKEKIRELNRIVAQGRNKLDRAHVHRVRLENALDIAETTREGIVGRYHSRIAQIARPQGASNESTPMQPADTGSDTSILASILELLAPKLDDKQMTMVEMTKTWNSAFIDAPMRSVDFTEFWQKLAAGTSTPEIQSLMQQAQSLPSTMQFKEWIKFFSDLYNASEEFRSFVKNKVLGRTTIGVLFGKSNKTDLEFISDRLRLVAAHSRNV